MEFHRGPPSFTGCVTRCEGLTWVKRRGAEPVSDVPIDVLAPDGRNLGTFAADEIRMPRAFGPSGLVRSWKWTRWMCRRWW